MTSIFDDIAALLAAGENIAVATVVRKRGSTPREIGAKMVVRASGAIIGTVGGGCGEAEVWRTAVEVIRSRKPRIVMADLTQEISLHSDGVCGGLMDVYVEAWWSDSSSIVLGAKCPPVVADVPRICHPAAEPHNRANAVRQGWGGGDAHSAPETSIEAAQTSPLQIAQFMAEAARERRPAALATIVACKGGAPFELGAKMVVLGDGTSRGSFGLAALDSGVIDAALKVLHVGEPRLIEVPGGGREGDHPEAVAELEVFVEPFKPAPALLIAGAGHIAVPLARIGKLLDFDVAVVDDRASFASKERFPEADQIIVSDFVPALRSFNITSDTYIILVTRGHSHDVVCLQAVIDSPAAYIGMIGSRRRVFAVFKLLHEEGVPTAKLARIHSPIGLDLAAETPAEIALSIIAEVVKVMRGGKATSLSEATREKYLRLLEKGEDLD